MSLSASTAMMSAPSSASLTAWLRPCPRAAPVMKATLPSTRPAMFRPPRDAYGHACGRLGLLDEHAGVDRQCHTGDVPGLVREQEQHGVADVPRLHPRYGKSVHGLRDRGEVIAGGALDVGA